MKKRIVICGDGTWNRPEQDLDKDVPTNVLKLARAIKPMAGDGVPQQVFYDWGIGSDHDKLIGGVTGRGIHKNIMDDYRYIVQNYSPGDELYLFGFSRGAYTVRCLCGLINNCGILKRPDARLIEAAFDHYKKPGPAFAPDGEKSLAFRKAYAHPSREVQFVGVWDTVGALGIPLTFLGMMERKDEFYDTKIGGNVHFARHAMAIDEQRTDFEPTIWELPQGVDMKQVWFVGSHSDVGGSYKPDGDGALLSDIALEWMMREAAGVGLTTETHLRQGLNPVPTATLHQSRRHVYRSRRPYHRPLDHGKGEVLLHKSVKQRWEQDAKYRPRNLADYVEENGWTKLVS